MKHTLSRLLVLMLAVLWVLSACSSDPAGTLPDQETTTPASKPPESPPQSIEELTIPLSPGAYILASVGVDGDITFFGTLDRENGYLELYGDGTGLLYWNDTSQSITWKDYGIITDSGEYPAFRAATTQAGDTSDIIAVYLLDQNISLVFRPEPAPESPTVNHQ